MKLLHCKSLKRSLLSAAIFTSFENPKVHDRIRTDDHDEDTGWKRLKKMYSYDEYGAISPQFVMVTDTGAFSFLAGFMFGAFNQGKQKAITHKAENRLTPYLYKRQGRKILMDKVILSSFKGGLKVALRLGYSSSVLMLVIISMSTYRGYSSVADFSLAGATTFSLYKILQGPKAQLSGAAIGGCLGTAGGALYLGALKLIGTTFADIHQVDAERLKEHNKAEKKRMETARRKEWGRAFRVERAEAEEEPATTEASKSIEPKNETSNTDGQKEISTLNEQKEGTCKINLQTDETSKMNEQKDESSKMGRQTTDL